MRISGFKPRPAAPDDVLRIQEFIAAIYADYGFVMDFDDLDRHLVDPLTYFRSSGGDIWVVQTDGRIAATVAVTLHPDDSGELRSLYVRPDARRTGLGSKLVRWVEAFARRAGKARLILWSDTHFTDAHRLYLRLGYRQTGERQFQDINHTRELGFERALNR